MKETVLDIVQYILSAADGDEVNSISDTVESTQAAEVVQVVYDRIVEEADLEHIERTKQLNATSSSTPTVMGRPAGFHDIQWVKYDKRETVGADPKFVVIPFSEPEDFINKAVQLNASASNVTQETLASGFILNVYNDRGPSCWTHLDGPDTLIFDAYDVSIEANLQASKSLAYGDADTTLVLADTTIPDLPSHLFVLLKAESVAHFFDLYKGGATRMQLDNLRRARIRSQRIRRTTAKAYIDQEPNYGRK